MPPRLFCFYTDLLVYKVNNDSLASEDTSSSGINNLLLRKLGEVFSLDNDGDGNSAVPEKLKDSLGNKVNNGSLSLGGRLGSLVNTLSGNIEKLVNVGGLAVLPVLQDMKLAHSDLSEVTGMVLVKHNPVVVLSSGVTASSGVVAVLPDTTMTGGDVSPLLPVFAEAGRLRKERERRARRRKSEGAQELEAERRSLRLQKYS